MDREAIYLMPFFVLLLTLALFKNVEANGGPKGYFSNQWLLKTNGGRPGAKSIAENNGFQIIAEKSGGYFVLRKTEMNQPTLSKDEIVSDLSSNLQVEYLQQLKYLNRTPRARAPRTTFPVNDSFWSQMWHVHDETFPNMGVYNAWRRGYTGEGIHISVLDDGVEPDHPDLVGNYDASGSFDYLSSSPYVNHTGTDFHGTWCAGISSAVMNDDCVLGMAYMSTFGAVKIFDTFFGLTDFGESLALAHELARTDIYSNSWGPSDTGDIFEGPHELAKAALTQAMKDGRDGLGPIYTWAAGNGGINDDCNCDGYANSIYTISVTSIGRDQAPSWYSEECSSIMVGTYSGDSPDLRIATTDTGGGCTTVFQGTSASCPMAAGIIALVLEANPTLSWRDIQHLIVETSTTEGLIVANWQVNGAGHKVSHGFGFGIMNAEAMLDASLTWQNVPAQVLCEGEMSIVNRVSDNGVYVIGEHESNGCSGSVQYLEHVEVAMTFHATYRGSLQITLFSPFGTKSRLLRNRRFDTFNGTTEWTFMTVQSWGELASGTWTLQLETTDSTTVFGLDSWKLILYGTDTPTVNSPQAQVSEEPVCKTANNTGAIVGGIIGGVALVALAALLVYMLVIRKPFKDPTIYPTNANGQANTNNRS